MADSGHPATSVPPSSPPLSPRQQPDNHYTPCDLSEPGDPNPRPENDYDSSSILPLPAIHISNDDSITHNIANTDDHDEGDLSIPNRTTVEEGEMHRKLMDVESSFLPEPSAIRVGEGPMGLDDTYLVGVSPAESSRVEEQNNPSSSPSRTPPTDAHGAPEQEQIAELEPSVFEDEDSVGNLGDTPLDQSKVSVNTTSLETPLSSPTAAAAARTMSRAFSATTSIGNEGENNHGEGHNKPEGNADAGIEDTEATPRRSRTCQRRSFSLSRSLSSRRRGDPTDGDTSEAGNSQVTAGTPSDRRRKRPKFLTSRQSSHRYSTSSVNTDTTSSDAHIGVDYALQSGGAVPANNDLRPHGDRKQTRELSRSTSLGSMASGISGFSDENPLERRGFSGISEPNLHTLDEEDAASQSRPTSSGKTAEADDDAVPTTPKAKAIDQPLPTDTVIAQHVQDIQVPGTFARQFRESNLNLGLSPDKRGVPTPGFSRGKNMTLKEQSSTIDRLSKENFDLKMRIHFLNEALNKRSEEGVKEMISENVELKSDKLKLQKDNQSLRKKIRELEKQLRDHGEGEKGDVKDEGASGSEEERATMEEEELIYLQERLETYEIEIERLRSESIARETEKRRLAEMVKSLSDGRVVGSEAGAREERDMWKDMLDAEAAAREQAEEENRHLREEILQMRGGDAVSTTHSRSTRRRGMSSVMSHPDSDAARSATRGTASSSTLVEIELLKQENAELRREVSAQTSMLTSRNREKERLYHEIEELKLQRRFDGRSIAGDSIFERSASRAQDRSASRASDGTRASRMSDTERESLETKNGELRDQVSTLKLENQGLRAQLDEYMSEIETMDRAYQEDMDQAEEEVQTLQLERDQAIHLAEEREAELQDLKAEAQEEINALEDELDLKTDEGQRMEAELRNQQENLRALQAEMRSANEGILRLEEDAQNNLQKYKAVQQELEDANRELEALEKNLFESNSKIQRLTVQLESSQNEIAFLREEQDADKIKIGDLESDLKTTQINLQSERDQTRELDCRLAEERHQREVVGGKEKQEVQRIMNELNRENTGAKDEIRKLKKALSAREIEANTWKERLFELESSLREALGDLNGTRSSLLLSITKLQKELESTTLELQSARETLDEKEALLRNRDALLESHGLETRKLSELLERERQAHRADKHSFEQALKSHHQASRTIAQSNTRISDLEHARGQDRKRFSTLEQQYKDQLNERNAMFLAIWKRLSVMCGPDWAHSNSLINGNLPSQEVIGNMLFWPGFSKNLLLALKTVEHLVNGFKGRVKNVERDLTKAYQNLEHTLNIRLKKLDRLEELAHQLRVQKRPLSSNSTNAEISKLRGENRLLKAELNLLQSHSRSRGSTAAAAAAHANPRSDRSSSVVSRAPSGIPQPAHHHSSSTALANNSFGPVAGPTPPQPNRTPSNGDRTEEKWIHRLRELERRLKAEREARLLDRSGARKRLEERSAENEELRAALERERMAAKGHSNPPGPPPGAFDEVDNRTRGNVIDPKSSHTKQSRNKNRPRNSQSQTPDTGTDLDGDERHGEMVLESRDYEPSQGRHHHREDYRHRRDETPDGYDGEEDEDEGTGTGTSDGGGLCVEVEV
ncbi:anucleate primary sterigmata protein B [Coccidioides immitis RS]|uniref:Anucleate primary sterigmata protein B n=2 Tax=Coccidioides immitis TaxID=5501 RepID=J3KKJ4_COCIM|nr:anucleate primary sterigmata protein B [Coccidioides immitis RS]EAS36703.3 anucleate primary sterigmata protein B [Coccidioides immitis RS]